MDDNVSEAHEFSPRNLGMDVPEFRGDTFGCFTQHSKLKQHGILVSSALQEVRLF